MKEYLSTIPEFFIRKKDSSLLKSKIIKASDVAKYFRQIFDPEILEIHEEMFALFLNRANNTIGYFKVSQGGLTGTICENKLILKVAIDCLALGIILCHNHPSGNCEPSESDIKITKKLETVASYFEIILLDHIILTKDSFYSFKENNILLCQ